MLTQFICQFELDARYFFFCEYNRYLEFTKMCTMHDRNRILRFLLERKQLKIVALKTENISKAELYQSVLFSKLVTAPRFLCIFCIII